MSEAMQCIAENVCYQSLCRSAETVYILGANSVYAVSLRTWLDQVQLVEDDNDPIGAIWMAIDFYTGRRKITTIQNGGGAASKRMIADKLATMIIEFVDRSLGVDCPTNGKIESLIEHYRVCLLYL